MRDQPHPFRGDGGQHPEALEQRAHRLDGDGRHGWARARVHYRGRRESDAAAGKISNESPVGSVLLGHKKGDKVETTGPTGRDISMVILKIEH